MQQESPISDYLLTSQHVHNFVWKFKTNESSLKLSQIPMKTSKKFVMDSKNGTMLDKRVCQGS